MPAVNSLHAHLVEELTDLRDAETQLTEALPKLAQSASSRELRAAFQKHLKETRTQLTRLDQALRALGEKPSSKTCEGMKGLLKEGEKHMKNAPEGALRDAVLIAGAQKVEHYEMAGYGTARTYAQVLGQQQVARLLEQTLEEEKATDRTLTEIAESSVNEEAAEEFQSQNEAEEGPLMRSARRLASSFSVAQDRSPRRSSRNARTQRSQGRRRRATTKKR